MEGSTQLSDALADLAGKLGNCQEGLVIDSGTIWHYTDAAAFVGILGCYPSPAVLSPSSSS